MKRYNAILAGILFGALMLFVLMHIDQWMDNAAGPCVVVDPAQARQAVKVTATPAATYWLVEQRGNRLSGVIVSAPVTATPTRRVIKATATATSQPYPAWSGWPTMEVYP